MKSVLLLTASFLGGVVIASSAIAEDSVAWPNVQPTTSAIEKPPAHIFETSGGSFGISISTPNADNPGNGITLSPKDLGAPADSTHQGTSAPGVVVTIPFESGAR